MTGPLIENRGEPYSQLPAPVPAIPLIVGLWLRVDVMESEEGLKAGTTQDKNGGTVKERDAARGSGSAVGEMVYRTGVVVQLDK